MPEPTNYMMELMNVFQQAKKTPEQDADTNSVFHILRNSRQNSQISYQRTSIIDDSCCSGTRTGSSCSNYDEVKPSCYKGRRESSYQETRDSSCKDRRNSSFNTSSSCKDRRNSSTLQRRKTPLGSFRHPNTIRKSYSTETNDDPTSPDDIITMHQGKNEELYDTYASIEDRRNLNPNVRTVGDSSLPSTSLSTTTAPPEETFACTDSLSEVSNNDMIFRIDSYNY